MALVQHKVGATAKAEVRRLNKRSKRSGWLQRSNAEDEAAGGEGEVGMGELESIMEKAEGGPKIPSWVPGSLIFPLSPFHSVCLENDVLMIDPRM